MLDKEFITMIVGRLAIVIGSLMPSMRKTKQAEVCECLRWVHTTNKHKIECCKCQRVAELIPDFYEF